MILKNNGLQIKSLYAKYDSGDLQADSSLRPVYGVWLTCKSKNYRKFSFLVGKRTILDSRSEHKKQNFSRQIKSDNFSTVTKCLKQNQTERISTLYFKNIC